jgi:ParB family chromosome partitioning protein
VSARKGLPGSFAPRHDRHYVDRLAGPAPETIGLLIDIKQISPNESQPREQVGDLSGLKTSIKEKGVIEPLVVKEVDGLYILIAGERRYRACIELGLEKIPCVIRESDDQDTLEIALIENLQRKDLTAFEEADALKSLSVNFKLTHEAISAKIGKSRNTISETVTLSNIPPDIRTLCSSHNIFAKSVLLQIARQETHAEMLSLTKNIIEGGMNRAEVRQASKPASATSQSRPFTYRHKSEEGDFTLMVKFKKTEVEREELIGALRSILKKLEDE